MNAPIRCRVPVRRFKPFRGRQYNGGVAQLGERVNGIHEVRGSIPLASTARLGAGRPDSETDAPRYTGDSVEVRLGGARGNSSVGRAQPCQGWGRGFESRFPLWKVGKLNVGKLEGITFLHSNGPTFQRLQATRGGAVW